MFAAFLALVFLIGGGSRDDVSSLVFLRPACAFFAAYALTVAAPGDVARVRAPLLLLLALAVWMVIQVIPLPPGMWSGLPGRAALLEMDKLVGLEGTWRPISLSPSKTMNALASLVVPAAALLLYAVQANDDRRRIFGLLIVAAVVSALLGIGQIASGGSGSLYLYSVTNDGDAVGLFANRNHNAVFLATIFVIAAYVLSELQRLSVRGDRSAWPILVGGACLLVLTTLLVNGSRAGLLIGVLGLGMAAALYVAARRGESRENDHMHGSKLMRYLPVAAVLLVAVGAAAFLFTRSSSFDRLVSLSVADEIRVQVFPQIVRMAQDNWLLGTGFGSFEHAYRPYEASEWLNQTYLNNAHDDWLQWIIEGGLPAILIALAFMLWLGRTALGHWRARGRNPAQTRLVATALGVLVLLLVASALDYPLRVPSMMLYAVLMVALVADPPEPQQKAERRGSGRGEARSRRAAPGVAEYKGAVQ
ncbi:MAG: O-antigen ligase family protein [Pseudomonadota bacterium]